MCQTWPSLAERKHLGQVRGSMSPNTAFRCMSPGCHAAYPTRGLVPEAPVPGRNWCFQEFLYLSSGLQVHLQSYVNSCKPSGDEDTCPSVCHGFVRDTGRHQFREQGNEARSYSVIQQTMFTSNLKPKLSVATVNDTDDAHAGQCCISQVTPNIGKRLKQEQDACMQKEAKSRSCLHCRSRLNHLVTSVQPDTSPNHE
jgi:hypothetical protein